MLTSRDTTSWKGDVEDYTEDEPGETRAISVEALNQLAELADEARTQYAEQVVPGVSDDSVLEARRDTLEEVLALLAGK